jgi:hypothetical protein
MICNDFQLLNYKCIVCGESGHFKSQCYREKMNIKYQQFSQFYLVSQKIFEKSFVRLKRKKYNALQQLASLQTHCKHICADYTEEIDVIHEKAIHMLDNEDFEEQE